MSIDADSLQTIIRRASTVAGELSAFTGEDYPAETTALRDVLNLVLEYLTDTLYSVKAADVYSPSVSTRVQQIARSVHEVFAMVRYLRASASLSSPPALHALVTYLVETHLGRRNSQLTVVRPQWEYNCKFVNLTYELSKILITRLPALTGGAALLEGSDIRLPSRAAQKRDPVAASQQLLEVLRKRTPRADVPERSRCVVAQRPTRIPQYIGVLSIAGVDKDDVFLYPMMAHEVAHFIAFSLRRPRHLAIVGEVKYSRSRLRAAIDGAGRRYAVDEIPTLVSIVTRKLDICIRELLADIVAVRLFGLGFFYSLAAFLGGLFQWTDPLIDPDSNYPSMRVRLKVAFDELMSLPDITALTNGKKSPNVVTALKSSVADWRQRLQTPLLPRDLTAGGDTEVDGDFVHDLATNMVLANLPLIHAAAHELVPTPAASIDSTLDNRLRLLDARLPPLLPGDSANQLPVVFTAAWLHRHSSQPTSTDDYARRGRLVTKAIELLTSPSPETSPDSRPAARGTIDSGVLTGAIIRSRTRLPVRSDRRISVIPFTPSAAETASLDVHLGNWFKLSRRPKMSKIDLTKAGAFLRSGVLHDEFYVEIGQPFILHAGDFALGITREFIGMPRDVMAFVEGKSSLGRTGLIVATATQVAPGFHGCIVLELANSGTVPLEIRPGMRVAQLIMIQTTQAVTDKWAYSGEFDCQIKP